MKSEKPSPPVVQTVDLSKVIRTVGAASQNAVICANRVNQQLANIQRLLQRFEAEWDEGAKQEDVPSATRLSAMAALIMAQVQAQQVSTNLVEALVHAHNSEAARAEVKRVMDSVRAQGSIFSA